MKLTVDQLREIRASMTWGDQAYGNAKGKGDSDAMIKHAMHRAAQRLGLAEENPNGLDGFLDMILMDDLSAALEDDRKPTSPDTQT